MDCVATRTRCQRCRDDGSFQTASADHRRVFRQLADSIARRTVTRACRKVRRRHPHGRLPFTLACADRRARHCSTLPAPFGGSMDTSWRVTFGAMCIGVAALSGSNDSATAVPQTPTLQTDKKPPVVAVLVGNRLVLDWILTGLRDS